VNPACVPSSPPGAAPRRAGRRAAAARPAARGFTLLEVLAVVAILGILGAIGWRYFTTDRTRATALVTRAGETAKGLVQFKQDVSCYPTALQALYDRASAQATRCGLDGRTVWREPYIPRVTFTAAGNVSLADLVPGAEMTLAVLAGGAGQQWVLRVSGVPNDVLVRVAEACNGGTTLTGRCTVTPGAGAATGQFDLLFDETT
jgi:prepilin-type N-terminal cleavage/methylation domain-containing protein